MTGCDNAFTGCIVTIAGNSGTNTLCVKMANNDVDTPAKDATWGSEHEYALIGWAGNTMMLDSLAAEGLPVSDAGMGTYVSPGAPNNPGSSDGVNIAGNTSIGVNSAVELLGGTLLDGSCIAP